MRICELCIDGFQAGSVQENPRAHCERSHHDDAAGDVTAQPKRSIEVQPSEPLKNGFPVVTGHFRSGLAAQ
jgi:hypothetical protein